MNADKRLALLNLLRLGKGSCPIGKHPRKKLLTRGASYKPPALPGDIYQMFVRQGTGEVIIHRLAHCPEILLRFRPP